MGAATGVACTGGKENPFPDDRRDDLVAQVRDFGRGRVMRFLGVAAAIVLVAGPAPANDGFGGLTATGLTFGQTDAVAMESEDLRIAPDRIEVAYVFRNTSGADVTGEVIFPLPPIPLSHLLMSDWNLPEDLSVADPLNFAAVVDGRAVAVTIDRVAVIEPEWDESRISAAQYDTPGRDVTAVLARFGIPVSLEADRVAALLLEQPDAVRAQLMAEGVADFYTPASADEGPPEAWPLWSVVLRYHWTQTFPAGAAVRVEHAYDNRPMGGLFYWRHPPEEDWLQTTAAQYCIDDATSAGIVRRLPKAEGDDGVMGVSWNIRYVLRTANSWAGPIGRFRLTLDKGDPARIVSLCAEGLVRTSETTFVMEKTDFVPTEDLDILLIGTFE